MNTRHRQERQRRESNRLSNIQKKSRNINYGRLEQRIQNTTKQNHRPREHPETDYRSEWIDGSYYPETKRAGSAFTTNTNSPTKKVYSDSKSVIDTTKKDQKDSPNPKETTQTPLIKSIKARIE